MSIFRNTSSNTAVYYDSAKITVITLEIKLKTIGIDAYDSFEVVK
jgi:hypothetical protein